LAEAARSLETAGSDFLVLCTNTMHKVAPSIEAAVNIPLLHIADPTAGEVKRAGHSTVGLLGTRFTMEEAFYRDRSSEHHGLQVIVPNAEDRNTIHGIIYKLSGVRFSGRASHLYYAANCCWFAKSAGA